MARSDSMVHAGKQPRIDVVLTGSTKKVAKRASRRIAVSSDEESEPERTPVRNVGGRPRNDKPPPEPLYDPSYPLNAFSLCVEKKGEHLPLIRFTQSCDYLDLKAELHDSSTEVGPKHGKLHMQSIFETHMHADEDSYKRFKTELKATMGVRWGDGSK